MQKEGVGEGEGKQTNTKPNSKEKLFGPAYGRAMNCEEGDKKEPMQLLTDIC